MPMFGSSRLSPKEWSWGLVPSNTAKTYAGLVAEFPMQVVGLTIGAADAVANSNTNYFTVTLRKFDSQFNVTRDIITVTNNGRAFTAGVPILLTEVSTAEDATNYTPANGFPLPQPYRALRPGDYLQLVVTTAGASPPATNLTVSVRYLESSQVSGRGQA